MFGLIKDLLGIGTDAAKIGAAPVQIAASLTRSVTAPIADVVSESAAAIREAVVPDDKQ